MLLISNKKISFYSQNPFSMIHLYFPDNSSQVKLYNSAFSFSIFFENIINFLSYVSYPLYLQFELPNFIRLCHTFNFLRTNASSIFSFHLWMNLKVCFWQEGKKKIIFYLLNPYTYVHTFERFWASCNISTFTKIFHFSFWHSLSLSLIACLMTIYMQHVLKCHEFIIQFSIFVQFEV